MNLKNSLGQFGLLMAFLGIVGLIFTLLLIPQILESFEYIDIAVRRPMLIISFIIGFLGSSFQFYVGIKGILSCQKDENYSECIRLGFMFLIMKLAIDIIYFMFLENPDMVIRMIGYVVVIFYIISAIISKKYKK